MTLVRNINTHTWTMSDASGSFVFFDAIGRLVARADAFSEPLQVLTGSDQGNVIRYLYDARPADDVVNTAGGGRNTRITYCDRCGAQKFKTSHSRRIGWSSSIFARPRVLPNGFIEYRDGEGETWVFAATSTAGVYLAPPGLFINLYRDQATNVLTMRDVSGNFSFFDSFGRLMARADSFADPVHILNGHAAGNVIRYLYDARGRLATIVDGAGRSTTITYGDNGYIREITDWRTRQVKYEYDPQGRLTTVLLPRVASASTVPSAYDFTSDDRRPRIQYGYATPPTQALNDVAELAANLTSITDPTGGTARVTFEYGTDPVSRDKEVRQTWATGETATMTYAATETTVTDALGLATAYDFAQQLDSRMHITQLAATVPSVNFNLVPLPQTAPVSTTLAQPVPLTTKFTYDRKGEIKTVQYTNNRIDQYTNVAPNAMLPWTVVQSIEEQGGTQHKTTFTYDAAASAPANATFSVQAQDAANGVAEREAPTASRARLKTTSVETEGATVGNETMHDEQGRPVAQRTISQTPTRDDILTPGADVKAATFVDYVHDTESNLYARGRAEVEHVAGTQGETGRYTHTYAALTGGGEHETIKDAQREVMTEIDRDAEGRVTHTVIKDSDEFVMTDESTGYDASGRVAYTARKQGSRTVITTTKYDAVGRAISTTMESGASVMGADAAVISETTYDLSHQTITTTDAHVTGASDAAKTVVTLDGLGRTIKSVRISSDGSQSVETDYGYDPLGNESYRTDTRTAIARRFDTQGREIGSVDESGVKTETTWSAWHEPLTMKTMTSDGTLVAQKTNLITSKGRLRGSADQINAAAPDVRWTWHAWTAGDESNGTLVGTDTNTTAPPNGMLRGTMTKYEAPGRPATVTSGQVAFTGDFSQGGTIFTQTTFGQYSDNLPGSVITTEVPAQARTTTQLGYDPLGRVISSVVGSGTTYTTTSDYDEASNLESITRPGQGEEAMTYDGRGLVLTDTPPSSSPVTFQYDALGNVRTRTDETGQQTTYTTDGLGRATKVTYPDTTTEETKYENATGLVKATKNRANEWRGFVYDRHDNVVEVHNVESPTAGNPQTLIERRTYDAANRLVRMTNADGAIEYEGFDLLGRPSITRQYRYRNGLSATPVLIDVYVQQHVWNVFGERTRWRMPYAGHDMPSTPPSPTLFRTWLDEQHDGSGNTTAIAPATDAIQPAASPLMTATTRSPGRLMSRTRTTAGTSPLATTYRYTDSDSTGLTAGAQMQLGTSSVGNVFITRDAGARIGTISDTNFGTRTSTYGYDTRGRLTTSALWSASASNATTDIINAAGFREQRQSVLRLSQPQHAALGQTASLALETAPWTAPDGPGHQLSTRQVRLDGSVASTIAYQFAGGRRTSDGTWTTEFDSFDRVRAIVNTAQGRRIEFAYDPRGRIIGRTAKRNGAIETDAATLAADGLPAETTFCWDPITDRLVEIFAASPAAGAMPLRQYVHGDQAYDDPIEVNIGDGLTAARYLPIVDESGTGNVTAVTDDHGNLVERVLYGDAYGDAPRYVQGPVVDHVAFEGTRDSSGNITQVKVHVRLSDTIDATSVAAGTHLLALNASNATVATHPTPPTLTSANEMTWTLNGTEWSALTSAPNATTLEVGVTAALRLPAWGVTPVATEPAWAQQLYSGVRSTTGTPVAVRASFTTLNGYITASATPRVLLDIADLYLAGSAESKTKLLTGCKSLPFSEPASGFVFARDRWYDPSTGTFLSPDAMGYDDSSNLYSFCAGDPVNCKDPTGLFGWRDVTDFAWGLGSLTATPTEQLKTAGRTAASLAGFAVSLLPGASQVIHETPQNIRRIRKAVSAYQQGGVSGVLQYNREEGARIAASQPSIGDVVLNGLPVVGTIRQAMTIPDTYYREGAFFGGMAVGTVTQRTMADVTLAYGAAKAVAPGPLLVFKAPLVRYAPVQTPFGAAYQSLSPEAIAARSEVQNGATVYRIGTMGRSTATPAEAQFWALEHPYAPGFADGYGVPQQNINNADFIEMGVVETGADFVTRPAPGIGANKGGRIEVVVAPNGVRLRAYSSGR